MYEKIGKNVTKIFQFSISFQYKNTEKSLYNFLLFSVRKQNVVNGNKKKLYWDKNSCLWLFL